MGFNYHGIITDMTKQLCHFVKELKYEDIPPIVIDRAKMNIMHTVGVSLCSAELQQIKDAIQISQEMSPGPSQEATQWATGKKPAPWAICWTGRTAPLPDTPLQV